MTAAACPIGIQKTRPLAAGVSYRSSLIVLRGCHSTLFIEMLLASTQHPPSALLSIYLSTDNLTTVSTQRRLYKKAQLQQGEGLLPERAAKLEELGFEWTGENPRHKNWDLRFEELRAFKARYGHAQVPIGFEDNVQLANWTSTQVR